MQNLNPNMADVVGDNTLFGGLFLFALGVFCEPCIKLHALHFTFRGSKYSQILKAENYGFRSTNFGKNSDH